MSQPPDEFVSQCALLSVSVKLNIGQVSVTVKNKTHLIYPTLGEFTSLQPAEEKLYVLEKKNKTK